MATAYEQPRGRADAFSWAARNFGRPVIRWLLSINLYVFVVQPGAPSVTHWRLMMTGQETVVYDVLLGEKQDGDGGIGDVLWR